MAASIATLAYVTEIQGPTIQSATTSRQAIRQYATILHKVAQQITVYAGQRQAAELAETDPAIDQLYADANMRIGAIMTTYTELQRHLRDLAIREAALAAVSQRIVARAGEL